MQRRKFLKLTATGIGSVLVLPKFLTANGLWKDLENNSSDNILVFIQLNGGNDGLNTFIPYENPLYYENRPTIGIPKDKVIPIGNGMGFHPVLKDFANISQQGHLSILQNVGYPNPNRSHFRSQEIWQTASDSHQFLDYGWLGRFLDIQCKDQNTPSVNVDSIDNLSLKAEQTRSITIKDFNKIKNYDEEENPLKLSGNPQLDFVRKLQHASIEGMEEIQKALKNAEKYNESYANNLLAKNLQWISKLIKGNLNCKIYYTSLSGFDTHNNQVNIHQRQLNILNSALFSFYLDLKASNLLNRVTIVIFSEFGRRVKENGTGTDHGTAAPMLIIGGGNKGKIIGKNPDLSVLDKGDLIYQIDFRSVYATLLQKKFAFDPKRIGIQNSSLEGVF